MINRFAYLFKGLKSFAQLEKLIAELPTNIERGLAFEIFAAAYLQVCYKANVTTVYYPFESIPLAIRKELGIDSVRDMGIDGIAIIEGRPIPYQAKYRDKRVPITWSESSTFVGSAKNSENTIFLTNSNKLNQHGRSLITTVITGIDFDMLTEENFLALYQYLSAQKVIYKTKYPQPHQQQAIEAIIKEFEVANRAQCIMACGTGKTLVGLWTSEALRAKTILVLLPTLGLLKQTADIWYKELKQTPCLYVCSDPTVKVRNLYDEPVFDIKDMDFPVTTKARKVREYLDSNLDQKIIFVTYHSAGIIKEAMKEDESWDLAIFDEAHKTAGYKEGIFSVALDDKNILCRKRLFMTATPRHYRLHPNKRSNLVYSMSNKEAYGETVFSLSLNEAAKQNIICNYKIIIGVTTEEVDLKNSVTVENNIVFDSYYVAISRALTHSIDTGSEICKVVSFHNTIEQSKILANHYNRLPALHINGEMSSLKRAMILKEFATSRQALLTNARVLTEGIDIPNIDMIAILSPKKSKIDIIQALGRALRKAENKALGYIFIPLLLHIPDNATEEDIEQAFYKSDYSTLYEVLSSIAENDSDFAKIITETAIDYGKNKVWNFNSLKDRVDIQYSGKNIIPKEIIQKVVSTRLLAYLYTPWDEMFGRLVLYHELTGSTNVPMGYENDSSLGHWVSRQRRLYKKGKLGSDKIEKLNTLDFQWEVYEDLWEKRFSELQEFHRIHGHANVPNNKGQPKLENWCSAQRTNYKERKLDKDRIKKLEALGFIWNIESYQWNLKFQEYLKYQQEFGINHISTRDKIYRPLGLWMANQRGDYRKGLLSSERIKLLEETGFSWTKKADAWPQKFNELKRLISLNPKAKFKTNLPKEILGWCVKQRIDYKKGKLSSERIRLLKTIEFTFEPVHEVQWNEAYNKYLELRSQAEHLIRSLTSNQKASIHNWGRNQKKRYKEGKLSDQQIKLLKKAKILLDLEFS